MAGMRTQCGADIQCGNPGYAVQMDGPCFDVRLVHVRYISLGCLPLLLAGQLALPGKPAVEGPAIGQP